MKSMKNTIAAALGLAFACTANALPILQLDIQGGIYDVTTQTVIAQSNTFTLYAYLIAKDSSLLDDAYGLSMALTPKFGPEADSLGTFLFNGQTIDATADMTYGTPPIDTVATQLHDDGDLSPHGIFDTYFFEYVFDFNGAPQSGAYNTADDTGQGPIAGTGMYYRAFTFDVTDLDTQYALHFDLYNIKLINACNGNGNANCVVGDVDQTRFAPFSHDAQSGNGGGGRVFFSVPEPGIIALLGIALAGLSVRQRARNPYA